MARQATTRATKKGAATRSAAKRSSTKRSTGRATNRSAKAPAGRSARPAAKKSASRRSAARQAEPKDLKQLFHDTLKDVYHAEKQLVRALPKMAKAAQNSELRQAIENHLAETQGQVQRLERVFEIMGERASTKPCHGMMGLVEEGQEVIKEFKGDPADAGIIGAAQAVEHYEIARYGTLKTWASQLGMRDAARLLEETLAEEKKADQLLTQIAESGVNQQAA
jgi:ferritin-like metal-binding protein YciE